MLTGGYSDVVVAGLDAGCHVSDCLQPARALPVDCAERHGVGDARAHLRDPARESAGPVLEDVAHADLCMVAVVAAAQEEINRVNKNKKETRK